MGARLFSELVGNVAFRDASIQNSFEKAYRPELGAGQRVQFIDQKRWFLKHREWSDLDTRIVPRRRGQGAGARSRTWPRRINGERPEGVKRPATASYSPKNQIQTRNVIAVIPKIRNPNVGMNIITAPDRELGTMRARATIQAKEERTAITPTGNRYFSMAAIRKRLILIRRSGGLFITGRYNTSVMAATTSVSRKPIWPAGNGQKGF